MHISSDFSSFTDSDDSSFEFEESIDSSEIRYPNICERKAKIPYSMDWSVQQLFQYLTSRGLPKLITDKIIENVSGFKKKKKPINVFL